MPSSSTPHRRWLRVATAMAAASALLGSSGCFKATFINPAVMPGETHEEWTDFFIGGLVGTEEFDVREFCPGEAAKVATGGDFLTGLVTVVTVGIYVPRKVYITCAAAPLGQPMPVTAPVPPGPVTAPPAAAPQPPAIAPSAPGGPAAPPPVAPTAAPPAPAPSSAPPTSMVPALGGAP